MLDQRSNLLDRIIHLLSQKRTAEERLAGIESLGVELGPDSEIFSKVVGAMFGYDDDEHRAAG